ncbi:MAG: tetratricopeptide repeat protein [Deltaproteobacteria bacterium]|nr:tetratricopeptide repeat protein [Deltaproteobacteria bacterium]
MLLLVSCASAPEAKVLGKLEAGKEELARLKRDISKVDKSIEVTRDLINRSKGERYLPDLYFRQAELYIEKSRLVYFRILEEAGADDKTAVVAPEARLLKDQAVSVYRRIIAEFPDYIDNDKAQFFIAHEFRELGNFPEMIKTYEELVRKYPKSNFRFESWLILGDYNFDKGDIDAAIDSYRSILKNQETYAHNMARYKLAWCYVNKDKTALAVDLWEQAVKTPTLTEPGVEILDSLSDKPLRLDVRQDALRDLAFYYAESRDPKTALPFFQNLTVSRSEYRTALEKLARRFQIKTMYEESAKVYRELIKISHDVDRNLEWAESVYESAVAAKDLAHADDDVVMLAEVAARYKYWWRASDEEKAVLGDFELLTRDLSTRLHAYAKEKNDDDLYRRSARAYERYLSVFEESPERLNMEWNFADTLYAGKRYVRAGRQYEKVLALLDSAAGAGPEAKKDAKVDAKPAEGKPAEAKPAEAKPTPPAKDSKKPAPPTPGQKLVATTGDVEGDRKQAMYSAILAYFEALKVEDKGSRFESMMAREGIKDLGARFVARFPNDANAPQVKFNVARAYFEQGIFDKAIELFTAFVTEHPTNKDTVTAAELSLDAFAQKEDFSGLAKQARVFVADARLDSSFRDRAGKMAEQAEQEEINRKTISAEGNVAAALASFVVEKKGSEVAAKALYQAFVIAKDRRNSADMKLVGRQLIEEYSNTKYAIEVLPGLADIAVRTSQLEEAASLFEEQARRFPDDAASDGLLENAATIRSELGEFPAAMADYERLAKQGDTNKRPQWMTLLAKTAVKAGDWRKAEDAGLAVADNGAFGIVGNAIAGEAALRTGKPDVAVERLSAAINGKGKGIDDADVYQARAQYLLGEVIRAEFERVQLNGGADDGAALQQKFGLLDELEAAYVAAIQAGDPEWAMGGLYRIANAYKSAADFLDTAPVPAGTSAEDEKALRAALAERSGPMKKKSGETLESCKAQARKLEAFNRFTRACFAGTVVDESADNPKPRPAGVVIPNRDQLEQKLVDNPKDVATLTALIKAAISVKDFPLARLLALRALEIDEKNADTLNLLGVASFQSNQAQAAAEAFKKALKINGRHPQALANQGALWWSFGDTEKGKDLVQKAGSVDTSAPDVLPQVRSIGGAR